MVVLAGLLVLASLPQAASQQGIAAGGSLLARSRRVCATDATWLMSAAPYVWLSDSNGIYVRTEGRGRSQLRAFPTDGTEGALAGRLNAALAGYVAGTIVAPVLSPDGRWLLGITYDDAHVWRWYAVRVDGSQRVTGHVWQDTGPRSLTPVPGAWKPDGSGWVSLIGSDLRSNVVVYGFKDPNAVHDAPLANADYYAEDPSHADAPPVSSVTAAGEAIAVWAKLLSPRDPVILRFRPDSEAPGATRHTVRLPPGGLIAEYNVSPTGDRVAWVVLLRPPAGSGGRGRACIYVSDSQGGGMRALGGEPIPWFELGGPYPDWPGRIRWLPSGKGLSFIYGDALYVTSVDRTGDHQPRVRRQ